jgi:hypothetical protein
MRTISIAAVALAALTAAPAAHASHSQLLGQWHLDNDPAVSDSTPDSSGHDLTASFGRFDAQIAGRFASAFDFHGGERPPTVPASTLLQPQRVTIIAWVRQTGRSLPPAARYVVAKGAHECTAASWGLYTGTATGDGLRFYVFDGRHGLDDVLPPLVEGLAMCGGQDAAHEVEDPALPAGPGCGSQARLGPNENGDAVAGEALDLLAMPVALDVLDAQLATEAFLGAYRHPARLRLAVREDVKSPRHTVAVAHAANGAATAACPFHRRTSPTKGGVLLA